MPTKALISVVVPATDQNKVTKLRGSRRLFLRETRMLLVGSFSLLDLESNYRECPLRNLET